MLKKIRKAFSNTSNWKLYFITALIVRGLIWGYFEHIAQTNVSAEHRINSYVLNGDYGFFFKPVDKYYTSGTFSYLDNKPYTGRLPGYSAVYFLFRLVLSPSAALFAVIILQFLLSALSVYVLALLAGRIFNSTRCFHITYWLYLIAAFPGFLDFYVLAESFSLSTLIFSLYYVTSYLLHTDNKKALVLSGLFLAITIFLREYTGLLLVLFPAVIGIYNLFILKNGFAKAVVACLLFCLPFIVFDTAWIVRNYMGTKKFIPITTSDNDAYGKSYSAGWGSLDNLVYNWGENATPFVKTTIAHYFRYPKENTKPVFPQRIFNNVTTYNKDSLVSLHNLYGTFLATTDTVEAARIDKRIVDLCTIYQDDYTSHHTFSYWFVKPAKNLGFLVLSNGAVNLPFPAYEATPFTQKIIKLFFVVFYYTLVLLGFIGMLWYFFIKRNGTVTSWLIMLVAFIVPATVVFFNPIQEAKYFVHAFVILLFFASWLISELVTLFTSRAPKQSS